MASRHIMHIHEWVSIRSYLMHVISTFCFCSRFQLYVHAYEEKWLQKERKNKKNTKQQQQKLKVKIYINRFMKLKLIISIYANVHINVKQNKKGHKPNEREREDASGRDRETIIIVKVYSFLTVVFMQYFCRGGCSFVHAIHFIVN